MNHRHQHFDWDDYEGTEIINIKPARVKGRRLVWTRSGGYRKPLTHVQLRLIAYAIGAAGLILACALAWIGV